MIILRQNKTFSDCDDLYNKWKKTGNDSDANNYLQEYGKSHKNLSKKDLKNLDPKILLAAKRHQENSKDVENSPTTKEDIKYAKKGMKEYVKNTKNAPKAKHFKVLDKETGEWRDGTKEDAKKFLSPEALKAQHDALIYESKLNRLNK